LNLQLEFMPMKKNPSNVCIASVGTATPPCTLSQEQVKEILTRHYSGKLRPRSLALLRKVLEHPSIRQRCFAFDNPESIFNEDPDERITRFTRWAVDLSAEAVAGAIRDAGLAMRDIAGLVVNTCTGYICPGLSTYLVERLGLAHRIRAYDLVGSGCGGALPNLQVAEALLHRMDEGVVVSVFVEICSATYQMADDPGLLISNALFGDGAAAAVLWKRPQGLELLDSSSRYVPEHREYIRYIHKNGQLYNQLSPNLAGLVKDTVKDVIDDVLEPRGLRVGDIRHWALHTGGEKVINSIRDKLELSDDQLRPTRAILARFGNISSPTVLFVLREILDTPVEEGDLCVMSAFGAGLSAHSYLMKRQC
jgi:predicted naringenin-chalcone synthase